MAFLRVTSQDNFTAGGASGQVVLTLPAAPIPGNLLVVSVMSAAPPASNALSGFTVGVDVTNNAGANSATMFYKTATGAEGTSLTVTATGGGTQMHAQYLEYTGSHSPVLVDTSSSANGLAATVGISTAITTTDPNDVVVALLGTNSTNGGLVGTWGTFSGFPLIEVFPGSTNRLSVGQVVQTSILTAATSEVRWTTARAWSIAVMAFRAGRLPTQRATFGRQAVQRSVNW